MGTVHVMDHPLILHKLSLMRDSQTGVKEFREATREIAMLMCYEATRDLPLKTIQIETPLGACQGTRHLGQKDRLCPHPARRSWHGRRHARTDSGGKGRSSGSVP